MKHNAVRKISQVAYRNKNEWRSRIQGKLQDLDSETNSYLDIYIADGINLEWLCDAERSLMTNILDESHKDMREARGLRLDPNKWTNESSLVRLIRKYWPRAKREFSPDWLDRQRLDVAIPNINLAFEYRRSLQTTEFLGATSIAEKFLTKRN